MLSNKKAFTLVEVVLVISIIWLLIAWITVYLWSSDEKRETIEAQWCASTLWGHISNYVFFALTSKNLRVENSTTVSPNIYTIWLSWWNSNESTPCNTINASGNNILCDKLIFWYSTWENDIWIYKEITVKNSCRQNQPHLWFFWSWWDNIKNVVMNKWFTTMSLSNPNTFYLKDWAWENIVVWEIIIVLCNKNCSTKKEIAKRVADWRSQTISLHNCAFYEDDSLKCKERES